MRFTATPTTAAIAGGWSAAGFSSTPLARHVPNSIMLLMFFFVPVILFVIGTDFYKRIPNDAVIDKEARRTILYAVWLRMVCGFAVGAVAVLLLGLFMPAM